MAILNNEVVDFLVELAKRELDLEPDDSLIMVPRFENELLILEFDYAGLVKIENKFNGKIYQ